MNTKTSENRSHGSALRFLYSHVGWLMIVLLIVVVSVWWRWAAPSFQASRANSAIDAMVHAADDFVLAQQQADQTHFILQSSSSSAQDAKARLESANQQLNDKLNVFEKDGSDALLGELTIISGVVLEVVAAISLLYVLGNSVKFIGDRQTIVMDDTQKKKLLKSIRERNLLEQEDDILRRVRDESLSLPSRFRQYGTALAEEYTRLNSIRLREDEEPQWRDYSKLLFHIFRLCREAPRVNGSDVKNFEDITWKRICLPHLTREIALRQSHKSRIEI